MRNHLGKQVRLKSCCHKSYGLRADASCLQAHSLHTRAVSKPVGNSEELRRLHPQRAIPFTVQDLSVGGRLVVFPGVPKEGQVESQHLLVPVYTVRNIRGRGLSPLIIEYNG